MSSDFSHLQASQRAIAELSNEERIDWIRQERWIQYPRAKRILERLADLVDYPPRHRMPCLAIYGSTGMGKTRIVQKFLRDNRARFDKKLGRHGFQSSPFKCRLRLTFETSTRKFSPGWARSFLPAPASPPCAIGFAPWLSNLKCAC